MEKHQNKKREFASQVYSIQDLQLNVYLCIFLTSDKKGAMIYDIRYV